MPPADDVGLGKTIEAENGLDESASPGRAGLQPGIFEAPTEGRAFASRASVAAELETARDRKNLILSFQPTNRIFAETLYVFRLPAQAAFATPSADSRKPSADLRKPSADRRKPSSDSRIPSADRRIQSSVPDIHSAVRWTASADWGKRSAVPAKGSGVEWMAFGDRGIGSGVWWMAAGDWRKTSGDRPKACGNR